MNKAIHGFKIATGITAAVTARIIYKHYEPLPSAYITKDNKLFFSNTGNGPMYIHKAELKEGIMTKPILLNFFGEHNPPLGVGERTEMDICYVAGEYNFIELSYNSFFNYPIFMKKRLIYVTLRDRDLPPYPPSGMSF